MSTLYETTPPNPEAPVSVNTSKRFDIATMALDQLGAQRVFHRDEQRVAEEAKQLLRQVAAELESQGADVDALRARTSLAFADLTARRGELIARRDEPRFMQGYKELFVPRILENARSIALDGLIAFDEASPRFGGHNQRRHIRGFLNELTALTLSLDGDPYQFAIPASYHDDRESSGFHFDIMFYDLRRKQDFRRAIDIKSSRQHADQSRQSKFASQLYADEVLHNNRYTDFWARDNMVSPVHLPTLEAFVGIPRIESPIEVKEKLDTLRQNMFRHVFTGNESRQ